MEQNRNYILPEELKNNLIAYIAKHLGHRPYEEVAVIIGSLGKLEEISFTVEKINNN